LSRFDPLLHAASSNEQRTSAVVPRRAGRSSVLSFECRADRVPHFAPGWQDPKQSQLAGIDYYSPINEYRELAVTALGHLHVDP